MAEATPFGSVTIQFAVPGIKAGVALYRNLFGKPPDFEPYEDFKEWKATPGATKIIGRTGNLFGIESYCCGEQEKPPGWVGTLQSALPLAGLTRPEAAALTPRDSSLLTRLLGPVLSPPGHFYDKSFRARWQSDCVFGVCGRA